MAYTYSKIATVTVGSGGVSSIDFLAIPQNYTDLVIKFSLRSNRASVVDSVLIRYNYNTSSYTGRSLVGNGASGSSDTATGLVINGDSATASTFGNGEVYIPNYAGNTYKSRSGDGVQETNATTAYMNFSAHLWSNSSPINSITLVPENGTLFNQYSTATLYGIKAEV